MTMLVWPVTGITDCLLGTNFNSSPPELWQNGHQCPDDIFKRIFVNENVRVLIRISLKFVPETSIDNMPALVQVMAWRRQVTNHYLNQCWPSLLMHIGGTYYTVTLNDDVYCMGRHYALLALCDGNPVSGQLQTAIHFPNLHKYEVQWMHISFQCRHMSVKAYHVTGNTTAYSIACEHIEARTKLPPFRRRYFEIHFFNEYVPKFRINNIPALVQIMAKCRPGDKPLSEPMTVSLLTHISVTRLQWVKANNVENIKVTNYWTPSQYKDRLIYVWWFPC